MLRIRPAAVAGRFYPGRPDALARAVDEMLAGRPAAVDASHLAARAFIVPHAGYVYSGPIAASAYRQVRALGSVVRRVVLLGPSHFVPVRGLATPGAEAFETPLGRIALDLDALTELETLPFVSRRSEAHEREHSLEVQLPFLQRALPEFTLVPLVVGGARPAEVAAVLERLEREDTLVLISSDLSHYLPYEQARDVDRETADQIVTREFVSSDRACGAAPVNGVLEYARRRGLRPALLDLRNSGDTSGDKDGVVGYAAFALSADPSEVRA